MVKVLPIHGSLSTARVPPIASVSSFESASPRPVPSIVGLVGSEPVERA